MNNTRIFSDLDLNFVAHPVTGDITKRYDENAIKQSIKNLVLTTNYERPFHPEIGSQITNLLFEPMSPLTQNMLEMSIYNTIRNFEPRVELLKVTVTFDNDNHHVYASIVFKIVNTERPVIFDFTLQRTR
jgi:phage baseplate assembly protein W